MLTTFDNIVQNLVDCVLILAGPAGDKSAEVLAAAAKEAGGGGVGDEILAVGEESAQVGVEEFGTGGSVMDAFDGVMVAQGGF